MSRCRPTARVVTAGADGLVRVMDLEGGRPTALTGHEGRALRVLFSADGSLIASAGRDGTARLWDLESGEARALRGHAAKVQGVVFLPDGDRLVTADADGEVRLWADDFPHDPARLQAWIAASTTDTIAPRKRARRR